MKVKDLINGSVVWYKNTILGVKGGTLSDEFDDFEVEAVEGNDFDFEIMAKKTKNGYIKIGV